MQTSCTESNVDVMYSSVVFKRPKGVLEVNVKKKLSLSLIVMLFGTFFLDYLVVGQKKV